MPTPMITIKKQDGTQVKMTLDEFKVYQQTRKHDSTTAHEHESQPVEQPVKEVVGGKNASKEKIDLLEKKEIAQEKEEFPMVLGTEALATVSPVKDAFIDEARYIRTTKDYEHTNTKLTKIDVVEKEIKKPFALAKDDVASLLEEDETDVPKAPGQAVTVGSYDDMVKKIIIESGVRVPTDLKERVSSLVLSYIKQVRDNYQFMDYATRPAQKGGAGLSQDDAQKLLSIIKKTPRQAISASPLSNPENTASIKKEFISPSITAPKIDSKPVARVTEPIKTMMPDPFLSKASIINQPAHLAHDIMSAPVQQKTAGPEEEMSTFSLSDFRRLARDPNKARDMLFSKMQGWKTESFLLYMKIVRAWRMSPLYRMYMEVTRASLEKNITIPQILIEETKSGGMTFDEYKQIVKLNSDLSI